MAKFSFPLPGRKKLPPQVTVTAPPTSKAQRILGSTALNIDAPKSWDEASNPGMSISVTESTFATSYTSTTRGFTRHEKDHARSEREWADESDILPRHLRINGLPEAEDEFKSDMSSVIRKRTSSSTLVSWYDKTKQPLAISQQTSASAMAKGLPSKAHKMLDLDNPEPIVENMKKKKPGKLDFTQILSRARGKRDSTLPPQNWEGPLLEPDVVMKSPSIMSELTSPPPLWGRGAGRLQKRPTKESLRSLRSLHSEPSRPPTSGSTRRGQHHLNGLPNLYEHYEQMSFRQVMEDYDEPEEEQKQNAFESGPSPTRIAPILESMDDLQSPTYHSERIISQYANRNLPQTPQGSFNKHEEASPIDCAASISSRHTRTSKASKRTDRSFQDSDLLEKSVLSLSSDSEEDVYIEPALISPISPSSRRRAPSDPESLNRPSTSQTSKSASQRRLSMSSKGSKRASFAPSSTYLTIPNGQANKLPAISARSSSLSGNSLNTLPGTGRSRTRSASRVSVMSNSSAQTNMTWQSKPGFGVQEARAITMLPALGPLDAESEPEDGSQTSELSYLPESHINSADQPTPPLSPTSVDFYIRSAHSSIDGVGSGSHNRFMAVTRQEELLLAALRHKRQVMRETILSEFEDGKDKRFVKGHRSKPSEATITESNFDLDFPAPPSCKDRTTVTPDGTTVIDLRTSAAPNQTEDRDADDEAADIVSPMPTRPLSKNGSIVRMSQRESCDDGHERILLYLDRPIAQELYHEEGDPSPDLDDFMEEFDGESSGSEVVSEVLVYTQERRPSERSSRYGKGYSRRSSIISHNTKSYRASHASMIAEEEDGIPRPDSPISPEGLGAPPPRRPALNKKTARLSAVGPARWGNED